MTDKPPQLITDPGDKDPTAETFPLVVHVLWQTRRLTAVYQEMQTRLDAEEEELE